MLLSMLNQLAAIIIALAIANHAKAQPAGLPNSISPEFQRREFQLRPVPRSQPRPPPDVPPPQASTSTPAEAFVLSRIVLEGATALPLVELEPLWQPLLGQMTTLSELEGLIARISARYRSAGFILSQAVLPPQRIEDGIVRVQVIEGRVNQITADGGRAVDRATALRLAAPITVEQPLTLSTLERGLLLSRDVLGGAVGSILQPSQDAFGAADLLFALTPRPIEAFLAVDNRGSRLLGPWIARAGVTGRGLLGQSERLDAQFAFTPGSRELLYGQVAASLPLLGLNGTWLEGTSLQFSIDHVEARPDLRRTGIMGLDTVQQETQLRLGLLAPLIRTRPESLFARASITWRESTSKTTFANFDLGDRTDRLFVFEPRLSWDFVDRFGGVSLLDGAIRKGLGVSGTTQVGARGAGSGRDDFFLTQLAASRLQRLGASPLSILVEGIGQWAPDSLPVSERFALGGDRLGRGFGPGNTTGDSGIGGRLELRYTGQVEVPSPFLGTYQTYAFGDWGAAVDRSVARDGRRWEVLASTGAGVRIDVTESLSLNPEVAIQIGGRPIDTATRQRDTRVFIAAIARY